MRTKFLFILSMLVFAVLVLAACSGTKAGPASDGNSSSNSSAVTSNASAPASKPSNLNASGGLDPQTIDGGSVTVQVTPIAFKMGAPLEFDIAMNTHSVDLSDDMLKAVILRDDGGKEYAPTAWDGPEGGGHHREGKITFAGLNTSTKSLTLVVKNIAGVPERVYQWELAQ